MTGLDDNLNATDADRLKRLYKQWKDRDRSHNQDVAAKILGISQSAVSQYVLGKIMLNLPIAAKFAKLFDCEIKEISPSLSEEFSEIVRANERKGIRSERIRVKYTGTLGPNNEIQLSALDADLHLQALKWTIDKSVYAIQIRGDALSPVIRNGWYVVVCDDGRLRNGEFVIVALTDGKAVLKEYLFGKKTDHMVTESILGGDRASFNPTEIDHMLAVTMILPPSAKSEA